MDSTMIIADVQPIARQIVYVQLVEMIGVLLLLVGTLLAVLIVLRVVCLLVVMLKPLFVQLLMVERIIMVRYRQELVLVAIL